MAFRLRPRDPSKHLVGNAILYGGMNKFYTHPIDDPVEQEVFFVETDFGNHMTLTWAEIEDMFIVQGWQDYSKWKQAREELRNQPSITEMIESNQMMTEGMFHMTQGFRSRP